MRHFGIITSIAWLCLAGAASAAQNALTFADAVCTDPFATYAQREDALRAGGWVRVADPDTALAWARATTALSYISNFGPRLNDEFRQAFDVVSSRLDQINASDTANLWQSPQSDAVLHLAEITTAPNPPLLVCEYVGTASGGMPEDLMEASRHSAILSARDEPIWNLHYVRADTSTMSQAHVEGEWSPTVYTASAYSGALDAIPDNAPIRFSVFHLVVMVLTKGTS